MPQATKTATFACGCFWSVELVYQRAPGVIKTRVGYTNGTVLNPSYKQVCTGSTGHAEAVQVDYDPAVISYNELLNLFWQKHDPTTPNRAGNDKGSQYRSGIYYHDDEQRALAEASKKSVQLTVSRPVVTEIQPVENFFPAEEYHQKYLEKGGQSASKGCSDPIACYGLPRKKNYWA
eukprot:GFYU01000471.1.p1 GENE.GFYU01000471.1~~GFYU01000471.1.p1  ORF type:complete len:177 (+),score=43.99 GFYU01000471.1:177-707(+)